MSALNDLRRTVALAAVSALFLPAQAAVAHRRTPSALTPRETCLVQERARAIRLDMQLGETQEKIGKLTITAGDLANLEEILSRKKVVHHLEKDVDRSNALLRRSNIRMSASGCDTH